MAYLDTSALVKLVVQEAETHSLRAWIGANAETVMATSTLTGVELRRASRRHSAEAAAAADAVLAGVDQIAMTPTVLRAAGALSPASLRTLDAIHLATALHIGSSLGSFVAYDRTLLSAAEAAGLPAVCPRPAR